MIRLVLTLILVVYPSSLIAAPLAEAVSADGRCRAVLSVSPDRPYLSDTITLTLDVAGPDRVEFPLFGEKMGELDVVDVKTSDRQLVLTAVPQRSGKTPIWAITIMCGQQRIDIPKTELDIATDIDPDTVSLDNICLATEPIPERSWIVYALALLLILAAVLILIGLFYKGKKVDVPLHPLSAQELALRRLAALLESRQYESDAKGFFVELSDIVRWYVECLTGIRAPELTTEEFLENIRPEPGQAIGFALSQTPYVVGLDESRHGNFNRLQYTRHTNRSWGGMAQSPTPFIGSLETLVPFLESADIVKFAKHVPTEDEVMLAFRRAEQFVRERV